MKKKLTPSQEATLAAMIAKGGGMTAAATRDAWEKGESYYIDPRNPLRGKGILRQFNAGNKDALAPANPDAARAKAYADLHHYAELVLSDLNDRKTGWYYQFSAAVEKIRNHFPPTP